MGEPKGPLLLSRKLRRQLRYGQYSNAVVDGVCAACRPIFMIPFPSDRDATSYTFHDWHSNFERFALSVRSGCQFCQVLSNQSQSLFSLRMNGDFRRLSKHPLRIRMFRGPGQWSCAVLFNSVDLDGSRTSDHFRLGSSSKFYPSQFTLETVHNTDSSSLTPYQNPNLVQNSKGSLPLAKMWLDECEANHGICSATRRISSTAPPSRLLYLDGEQIRLHLVVDYGSNPRYATLSHRWGDLKSLTLRRQDVDSFRQEIRSLDLCKTFQDAIHITEKLGLSYLWIDSLCIVQDDAEDWAHEAANMGTIYGGAAVTIAATSAEDGSKGCFFDRGIGVTPYFHFLGANEERLGIGWVGSIESCLETSPLNVRAWVFQVLSMTYTEMIWECKEARACESYPCGYPKFLGKDLDSDFEVNRLPQEKLLIQELELLAGFEDSTPPDWGRIVAKYMGMDITFSKDRLPAIAGIARKYQATMGFDTDSYIAGFWSQNFELQLSWRAFDRKDSRDGEDELPTLAVPSWSWANTKSKRGFYLHDPNWLTGDHRSTCFVSVIGMTGIPSGDAAFGAIEKASLEMAVEYLIPAQTEAYKMEEYYFTHTFHQSTHTFFYAGPDTGHDADTYPSAARHSWSLHVSWDVFQERCPKDVFLLPIEPHTIESASKGLILEKTGQSIGDYRRLGMFQYPDLKMTTDFEESLRGLTNVMDCLREYEGDGRRKYVISLV